MHNRFITFLSSYPDMIIINDHTVIYTEENDDIIVITAYWEKNFRPVSLHAN